MNLIAGKLYDPAVAVSKATTSAIALTALDTTNLRLSFTVPPSGMLWVRMAGTLHGATTFPQIILGVLDGSTVKGRVSPMTGGGNLAATTLQRVEGTFIATGTPGTSVNWDAAYGVETVVASTGLKYGGPNNTTANDNFGGFTFEIWDPCPSYTPSVGAAPASTVHVKLDAIDDFVDTEVGAIKAKTDQLTFTTANKVDSTIQAAADLAQTAADKVWSTATRALTDKSGFSLTQSFPTNFSALAITAGGAVTAGTVSDKTGYSLTTAPLDAAGTRSAIGLASANLDTQLSTIAGYIDTEVAAVLAAVDTEVAAIKAKTDSLNFTVAGQVNANINYVNGVLVNGDGAATPWGP